VDGAFRTGRHRWRATLLSDGCGVTEGDDFFAAREMQEASTDEDLLEGDIPGVDLINIQ
jgi:hypothetical protein